LTLERLNKKLPRWSVVTRTYIIGNILQKSKIDARTIATQILTQVIFYKQSLSAQLDKQLKALSDKRERALAQNICFGVLRYYERLYAIFNILVERPLKNKDKYLQILLIVGFYQLLYTRIPKHAATAATVNVIYKIEQSPKSIRAKTGLINAVLRNFQRKEVEILTKIDKLEEVKFNHPQWILKQLQHDWSENWQTIALANNEHAPLSLRVNNSYNSINDYLRKLQKTNLTATIIPYTNSGLSLEEATDVYSLPDFEKGAVSVQDGGAQLATTLLEIPKNAKILDACAAPGGKTASILENYKVKLLALDISETRVKQLDSGLRRLRLKTKTLCADASKPKTWWDGEKFDRILLDAPCSGSGVIRRHPDIKYLRRHSDIAQLVKQQESLLNNLWELLAPNGLLLYITCSVFVDENYKQIAKFLQNHTDAEEKIIQANWGHKTIYGRQILTGEEQMDGFYYACLRKV
jgi:16S rRNA (cytosine967-C5)-methyltransferase